MIPDDLKNKIKHIIKGKMDTLFLTSKPMLDISNELSDCIINVIERENFNKHITIKIENLIKGMNVYTDQKDGLSKASSVIAEVLLKAVRDSQIITPNVPDRKSGYYKVMICANIWTVAYWDGGKWFVVGGNEPKTDSTFDKIDETKIDFI